MKCDLQLADTQQQLKEWGYWCRDILTGKLGYSKKSIVGQLMENKGVMIKGTNDCSAPKNENAEKIDILVENLGKIAPKKARVLYLHYALKESTKVKITKSQLAARTYARYLQEGREWIKQNLYY